ncbi:hypothetical protein J6590_050463, partial [Homalodisca vitripennis]
PLRERGSQKLSFEKGMELCVAFYMRPPPSQIPQVIRVHDMFLRELNIKSTSD